MSIEMDNPVSIYEKVDIISNLIEQMLLASIMNDKAKFNEAHARAGKLCFDTMRQMEKMGLQRTIE